MSDYALAWRQFRLERHMFWRNPAAAVFNIVIPIIFLVVIGSLAGDQAERDIIVPGHRGHERARDHVQRARPTT